MNSTDFANSDQISKAFEFIEQKYQGKILLNDVAQFLNATETMLTGMIRKRNGKSFVDFMNDYRIGFASRWLTENNQSVAGLLSFADFTTFQISTGFSGRTKAVHLANTMTIFQVL